jgi:hypothetical protein
MFLHFDVPGNIYYIYGDSTNSGDIGSASKPMMGWLSYGDSCGVFQLT